MEKYMIIHRPDPVSAELKEKIEAQLRQHPDFEEDEEHPHTIIVIGGDGTFIYAVHQFVGRLNTVRFYGIHTGTLGFYTDYRDCDLDEFMTNLLENKGEEIIYPLLQVQIDGREYFGINEIRIENAARTQVMDLYINGEKFETFRGSGMCVCTQLGSTAYNRSLGGAVIDEGLDFIELTEISGIHHSKYRSLDAPLVLKAEANLVFKSDNFQGALLGVDSDVYNIDDAKEISVNIWRHCAVHMLRGRKVSYYERLKSLF
jgi:NAD+ kinase